MLAVTAYTILFCLVTVVSILLTGSRSFIAGSELTPVKIVRMLFDWHFVLGAGFAFMARLFFILVNNSLLKIPHLAGSSTTITTFITSSALVFVAVANHLFLGERVSTTQGVGMFVILFGIFLMAR